ncbi:hypothetical protein D9M70_548430 [compost metagenome]
MIDGHNDVIVREVLGVELLYSRNIELWWEVYLVVHWELKECLLYDCLATIQGLFRLNNVVV